MHCPQKMKDTCWVDSTLTLFWINNDRPWKQYVSRRVSEIQMSPSINQWRHCPGTVNPADLPSCGLNARQLCNCALWWEGPPFLKLCKDDWPMLTEIEPCGSTLAELTKTSHFETHVLSSVMGQVTFNLDNVISCQFSRLTLLLHVTAQNLHFIELVKGSPLNVLKVSNGNGPLEAKELDRAETLWIQSIQV